MYLHDFCANKLHFYTYEEINYSFLSKKVSFVRELSS